LQVTANPCFLSLFSVQAFPLPLMLSFTSVDLITHTLLLFRYCFYKGFGLDEMFPHMLYLLPHTLSSCFSVRISPILLIPSFAWVSHLELFTPLVALLLLGQRMKILQIYLSCIFCLHSSVYTFIAQWSVHVRFLWWTADFSTKMEKNLTWKLLAWDLWNLMLNEGNI
jgi:hypothetical protein